MLKRSFVISYPVLSAVLALGVMTGFAPAIQAQDVSVAQSPAQMRDAGLALVFGAEGSVADPAAGMQVLRAAADAGDLRAQAEIGKMLLDGYYGPADPEAGLAYLDAAAVAGDAKAQSALGQALLWGLVTPADPEAARGWLEKSVASGNAEARRVLGEQLIGGWVLARDVAAGRALLDAAIAEGDAKAQAALSGLYLYGTGLPRDVVQARELAEAALAQGDGAALWKVGEDLMWREADPVAAEKMLLRAGEAGAVDAWATLAEGAMYGYLGGGKVSRAKYDGYAERARAAGVEKLALLEAQRLMWGISTTADGPAAVDLLRKAADDGNAQAARFLVQLLRDGNGLNVARDLAGAEAARIAYADTLGEKEGWRLARSLQAKTAHDRAAYAALSRAVAAEPSWMNKDFARDLYKANPNAMVYLLQEKLKAAGLYRAALDGYAGPLTIRALNAACRALPDDPDCADSVMRPDILATVLAKG